ncbi:fatty acid synthase-like [Panonychus citri]|uniref:fatty acid synthase-like n=1 Tax=Panonychus citri TaxID=50023 RepID=UPI00230791C4|nr:fatty acid synthase-like [Panonychus citri]
MDFKYNDSLFHRKWKVKEDVIISGMSGRFPKSESVDEFADNLFNSIDMMTGGNDRFRSGHNNLPQVSGKVGNLSKFDAQFFSIPEYQADHMDPQLRKLLEVSYEAIIDSGLSVESLRGSKTGFFYGSSFAETEIAWGEEPLELPRYKQIYTTLVPYIFDLKGPMCHFDTACGSSFAALTEAFTAIKSGICDKALVAGFNICLLPVVTSQFRDLQMVSRNGRSKCLDKSADGYGRSEAVCCIVLQKAPDAKRIYSTIVNCRSNADGYKDQGISFPSVDLQRQLMYETYTEVGLDPTKVTYVEAHCTGTQAGDPVELNAIHDIFCIGRDLSNPLRVGCLKSNMGHAEGASGICATVKANMIFQKGLISPNLHLKTPNPKIEGLMNKTIVPVTTITPFEDEIISLNCFGFGGANAHVILRGHDVRSLADEFKVTLSKLPRLVNIPGRSVEGIKFVQNYLESSVSKLTRSFLDLLNEYSKSRKMPHRGFTLIEGEPEKYSMKHFIGNQLNSIEHKKVYLTSSTNLINVDPNLKDLPVFSGTINRLTSYLRPFDLNLFHLVFGEMKVTNPLESIITSIAIQLAIVNTFKSIQLNIDGVVIPTIGYLIDLYANNKLTEQEVILTACWFGHFVLIKDQSIINPTIEVYSSYEQIKPHLTEGIKLTKQTSGKSCVISGHYEEMFYSIIDIQLANITVKWPGESNNRSIELNTNFSLNRGEKEVMNMHRFKDHLMMQVLSSDHYIRIIKELKESTANIILILNTDYQHFILPESIWKHQNVPLQPNQYNLSDMKKGFLSGDSLFTCLGKIYANQGINYHLEHLYPTVNYPVPIDTLSLNSLIKFDHSEDRKVFKYPEYFNQAKCSTTYRFRVNLTDSEDWFLADHKIDGRVLYPATGLLMLVWYTVARYHGTIATLFPIEFRDIRLIRATVLTEKEVSFTVQYLPYNGTFSISESDTVVAFGKAFGNPDLELVRTSHPKLRKNSCEYNLNKKDIYKELRVRGYDYGPHFQCLTSASSSRVHGKVEWRDPKNSELKASTTIGKSLAGVFSFLKTWITFTDSILQFVPLSNQNNRNLYVPTGLQSLICDPIQILEMVNHFNRLSKLIKTSDSKKTDLSVSIDHKRSIKDTTKRHLYPEFDVYHDPITQTVSTEGVWVRGLFASDTIRRKQPVTVSTYDFTPFHENHAVDEITLQSIESYSSSIFNLIDLLQQKILTSIDMVDCDEEIESITNTTDLNEDQHSFAKYLTCLCRGETPMTETISKLHDDLLIGSKLAPYSHQRFLQPFVNIATRSKCYGGDVYSEYNIVEINDTQGFLFDSIKSLLETQYFELLDIKYTLVRSNLSEEDTGTKKLSKLSGVKNKIIWNIDEAPAPSDLSRNDLVIYKLANQSIDSLISNIEKIQSILKPNGHLLVLARENSSNLESLRSNPFVQNLLKDFLPDSIDSNSLIEKMKENNWVCISKRTVSPNSLPLVGLMFKKLPESINLEKHKIIRVNPFEYSWLDNLKDEIKADEESIIWLVSQNVSDVSVLGLAKCLSLEPYGSRIRCVALQPGSKGIDLSLIDLHSPTFHQLITIDCKFNIYDDQLGWGDYCHFEIPTKQETDSKCLIQSKDAYVQCLIPGDLSSLVWTQFNPIPDSKKGQSLVTINYSSLNFKDIMHATGRLPSNLNPDWHTSVEMSAPIGLEYAGIDSNGYRIMGFVPHRALATKLIIGTNDFCWSIPSKWTMEDAATVPVVYATAIYGLLIRGELRQGESVLIHAGSGGVGIAAINICLSMNCRIFTTVGTNEKRKFLQEQFPSLDETSFTHSRSTTFEEHVLRHTNGRGVDVILNSLSEEKLQASVRCLAPGGRFLEIGKYDIMQDSKINLGLFDEGRTFHGILLDAFITSTNHLSDSGVSQVKEKITAYMNQGITSGTIKPLPRKVFKMNQVEEAFRFMATGKHIGKVLVKIKDETNDAKCSLATVKLTKVNEISAIGSIPLSIKSPIFYPNKAYVIVGGFGGFGLELACWLVRKGVRRLVLNSRSGPKSSYHKLSLDRLKSLGANVIISTHDLTYEQDCCSLLESLSPYPIGGIFNCALVLSDALLSDQNAETYEKVCSSKVKITKNLDKLTRSMAPFDCDYFVVFSSVTCGRGNPGQSNYGLANSYMESICRERFKHGLHGLAIQWGYVGDVGFVVEKFGVNIDSIRGTAAQRIHSCFSVLERALVYPSPVVSSWLQEIDRKKVSFGSRGIIGAISHILGIKDINSLDPNVTLGELGMDSLMAIEIQHVLEKQYSISAIPQEIRAFKISKLKELSKKWNADEQRSEILTKKSSIITLNDTNSIIESLLSLQVPKTITSNLNDLLIEKSKSFRPIYYMPPIEGNYDLMKGLIDRIKRPALGLNWTYDLSSLTSIESAANYYADYLTKCHSSNDKIHMIGYSFGGIIAYNIACELETRFVSNRNGPIIEKLILIDADPEKLKNVAEITINTRVKTKDMNIQETEFVKVVIKRVFSKFNQNQFDAEINKCSNRQEKFEMFTKIMIDKGIPEDKADMISKVNELTFQKGQMLINYSPKLNSKLTEIIHIRAKTDLPLFRTAKQTKFKLGTEHFFDGNHHIVIGLNLDDIVKIANNFFKIQ